MHRGALELGQDTRAVVDWARANAGDVAELSLMHAWTAFANGDPDTTETLLHDVLACVRPTLCPTTQLEARLLETALEIHNDQRTKARSSLDAALLLAAPADLIRPFHQTDISVRQLLLEQAGGFGRANEFATKVIHAVSTVDSRQDDALTDREHTVLVLLSSPAVHRRDGIGPRCRSTP
ncbi:hypothetical protein [Actinophytocola sp.]|uniref:hypothetical protein n=1 Tax=Actinophytocola sp. TaxID=1872138 RepID=UPI002ED6B28B